jgi:hypothetical protein
LLGLIVAGPHLPNLHSQILVRRASPAKAGNHLDQTIIAAGKDGATVPPKSKTLTRNHSAGHLHCRSQCYS